MSTYTPNLRLTLPNLGEMGWGDKVNNGITSLVETAICGLISIALPDTDYTLTKAEGAADESRAMFLTFTGTVTAPRSVVCPNLPKLFFVRNNASMAVVFKTAAGSGIEVPVGKAMALQCDGTNVVLAIDHLPGLTGGSGGGSAGADGAQGIQGIPGVAGADGAAGAQGIQGITGADGAAGIQGIQGITGADGATGATGPAGAQGIQGIPGADGTSVKLKGAVATFAALPASGNLAGDLYVVTADGNGYVWTGSAWNNTGALQGPKGNNGAQGVQGIQGETGLTGATGLTGDTGAQGIQGIQGIQGETGLTGAQGVKGDTGLTGQDGTSVKLKGSVATFASLPASGNLAGDLYVVTADTNSYVWTGSTWSNTGPLQGPKGDIGTTGAQGIQGIQGIKGDSGLTGATGLTGDAGAQGTQGIQGIKGDTGLTGGIGGTGGIGATGADGVSQALTRASTTSNLIESGAFKSFTYTTPTNVGWVVGSRLRAVDSSTPGNFMEGSISTVSSTDVTIYVDVMAGTGTIAAWDIAVTGIQGIKGDQGIQGIQGLQGVTGNDGPTGPAGLSGASGTFAGATVNGMLYAATATTMATSPTLLNIGGGLAVGTNNSTSMKAPAAAYGGATAIKVKGNSAGKIGSVIVESNTAAGSLEMWASDTLGMGLHTAATGPFSIVTANINRFHIDATGKVGINKAIPTAALDVVGMALIDAINVGAGAGNSATVKQYNTQFGRLALPANTTGTGLTAIGNQALQANTTGINNTGIGGYALSLNTTAMGNTAIGLGALQKNTISNRNTAVGVSALTSSNSLVTDSQNTAVGAEACFSNTTGINNTGVGSGALYFNIVGTDNTAIGLGALWKNTGSSNTGVGSFAAYQNTSGTANTAVGCNSLQNNKTSSNNTAIGYMALVSSLALNNTAVGAFSQQGQNVGTNNTSLGFNTLKTTLGGHFNVAVGVNALAVASSTTGNTAVGGGAMALNTAGANNTAIGYNCLTASTTPNSNTGVGALCMSAVTTGLNNAAFGTSTMPVATTASHNTALGVAVMNSLTTGSGNVCVGSVTSGGTVAPVFNLIAENDRVVMGSSSVTNAYVKVAWTVVSDARDKTNFSPVPHGLDFVNKLQPTSYRFKVARDNDTPNGNVRYGFKAQDILALEGAKSVIVDSSNPDLLMYNSDALIPVLVKAIQELTARVAQLEAAH